MKLDFNICIVNSAHSMAWFELAELIFFSLKELGLNVKIQFGVIDKNCRNIFFGLFLLPPEYMKIIPSDSIFINTEQLYLDQQNWWPSNIFDWAKYFETWDYSDKNIESFNNHGINNIKKLEIGYQKELSRIVSADKQDIDILFYGTLRERRKKIIDNLIFEGLNVKALFGIYGEERDAFIARSKVILNLHHFDSHIFEVVRVFYLITNKKAVVGEVGSNTSIDSRFLDCINSCSYELLVSNCKHLVKNTEARLLLEKKAFENFSLHPQRIFTSKLIS